MQDLAQRGSRPSSVERPCYNSRNFPLHHFYTDPHFKSRSEFKKRFLKALIRYVIRHKTNVGCLIYPMDQELTESQLEQKCEAYILCQVFSGFLSGIIVLGLDTQMHHILRGVRDGVSSEQNLKNKRGTACLTIK